MLSVAEDLGPDTIDADLIELAQRNVLITGATGKIAFARGIGCALRVSGQGTVFEIDGRTEDQRAQEHGPLVRLAPRLQQALEEAARAHVTSGGRMRMLLLITEGHEVPCAEAPYGKVPFPHNNKRLLDAWNDVISAGAFVEAALRGQYPGVSVLTTTSFPEALQYSWPGRAVIDQADIWLEAIDDAGVLRMRQRVVPVLPRAESA